MTCWDKRNDQAMVCRIESAVCTSSNGYGVELRRAQGTSIPNGKGRDYGEGTIVLRIVQQDAACDARGMFQRAIGHRPSPHVADERASMCHRGTGEFAGPAVVGWQLAAVPGGWIGWFCTRGASCLHPNSADRSSMEVGAAEPAILMLDNAPTRGDVVTLRLLAAEGIHAIASPSHSHHAARRCVLGASLQTA